MKNPKKDWFKKIRVAFNAFSEEPFSIYQKRCLTPLLNSAKITPPKKDVFKALEKVYFEDVKVVILGQDPDCQVKNGVPFATGLAFALNPKVLLKCSTQKYKGGKSLRKILGAVSRELKVKQVQTSDLTLETWAKQGVLLLNTALTTRPSVSGAHLKNWKKFTAALIIALNSHPKRLTFVLACNAAKEFLPLISPRHQVFFNFRHPSRCWRIHSEPNCTKRPINFFSLTSKSRLNWEKVFA